MLDMLSSNNVDVCELLACSSIYPAELSTTSLWTEHVQ